MIILSTHILAFVGEDYKDAYFDYLGNAFKYLKKIRLEAPIGLEANQFKPIHDEPDMRQINKGE